MKMKPLIGTSALLGIAVLASLSAIPPISAARAAETYAAALDVPNEEDEDEDDDFNGVRYKLFFPNVSFTYW